MGKIDIRRIEDLSDESVSFQKIKKKKTIEQTDSGTQEVKTTKRKK
jgi:hypothetical protein